MDSATTGRAKSGSVDSNASGDSGLGSMASLGAALPASGHVDVHQAGPSTVASTAGVPAANGDATAHPPRRNSLDHDDGEGYFDEQEYKVKAYKGEQSSYEPA